MKKMLILLAITILLFTFIGCTNSKTAINSSNADSVSVFYGLSSYGMFSNDKKTIKAVSDCFGELSFEETDEEIDVSSMIMVHLSKGDKQITKISVDEKGVFLIDDNPKCLKVASGTFNYNDVKDIYDRSKKGS